MWYNTKPQEGYRLSTLAITIKRLKMEDHRGQKRQNMQAVSIQKLDPI